jgi:hypothetical protein
MSETASQERNGVLAVLSLLLAVACIAFLGRDLRLVVSPWIFGALLVPAAAFAVLLRTHRDTWGREGRYVDYWSIPHFLVGVFGFLLGVALPVVAAIAVAWELIELAARVREYPANRVTDVVLAVAGWLAAYAARIIAA